MQTERADSLFLYRRNLNVVFGFMLGQILKNARYAEQEGGKPMSYKLLIVDYRKLQHTRHPVDTGYYTLRIGTRFLTK